MPSRRALLSALGAGAAALAGCTGTSPGDATDRSPGDTTDRSPSDATDRSPSDSPTDADTDGRPTATPRDPRPLDAAGAWRLRRGDPAHTGATDLAGVPDDATGYWHLRRLEGGPAVVAGDRLFHLAALGRDPQRRTRTATMTPGGTYIVREGDPHLVARDAATGELAWDVGLDGPAVGWPAVGSGTVVAGVNGHLVAADAASGDVLWERDLGEAVVRDPTVAGDAVYVPTNADVRAYALPDGTERWRTATSGYADGVAVADGTVYATTDAGAAYALDAASGETRWTGGTVGEASAPPTVVGDTVFVGGSAGVVAAHATDDGSFRWHREFGPNGWGGVAVAGDTVLYAGGGAVNALVRSDGTTRWRHEVSENYPVTPSVGDGVVYTGGRGPYEPELYALDMATGERRWSVGLPRTTVEGDVVDGGLAAPPAVVDGGLYVDAVDGLYALGPA